MDHFHIATNIYFGERALNRLSELDCKKAFVITDPFIVESDMIRNITKPLVKGGIEYELFTDVVPDPPIENVGAGVAAFSEAGCDCIVAVGGGSAMDVSKSIRKMVETLNKGVKHIKLICIPTTSGSGSEVTSFSVITDTKAQVKIPLISDDMSPDEAIIDAVLVRSVPAGVTADTGMDVLTHAIEAYVSIKHNDFSGALAERAVALCGQYLFRSFSDNNDTEAREKMHIAATLAGLAFNSASLGLNHGMAHQLGAHFHIPHGRANAILLPHIVEYNTGVANMQNALNHRDILDPVVECYCKIANTLGLSSLNTVMTIHSLINYLKYMGDAMGIPLNLRDILKDITREEYESHIDAMADAALDDSCTETNPRQSMKQDVINIYKKLW